MTALPTLNLLEQAVAAELGYYHQLDLLTVTAEDELTWHRAQVVREVLRPLVGELPNRYLSFGRYVLERHGYSLHQYMARQLSPAAWSC